MGFFSSVSSSLQKAVGVTTSAITGGTVNLNPVLAKSAQTGIVNQAQNVAVTAAAAPIGLMTAGVVQPQTLLPKTVQSPSLNTAVQTTDQIITAGSAIAAAPAVTSIVAGSTVAAPFVATGTGIKAAQDLMTLNKPDATVQPQAAPVTVNQSSGGTASTDIIPVAIIGGLILLAKDL